MDIPTLFDLDPTQFGLGRSTGRFQAVQASPFTATPEYDALMSSLGELSKTKPEAPVLPKAPYTQDRINWINTRLKQIANFWKNNPGISSKSLANEQTALKKEALGIPAAMAAWNTNKTRLINNYNKSLKNYDISVDTAVGEATQGRTNLQQEAEATGELLADTSLYSDDLHQQMLEKVGLANAEALPAEDEVTALTTTKEV